MIARNVFRSVSAEEAAPVQTVQKEPAGDAGKVAESAFRAEIAAMAGQGDSVKVSEPFHGIGICMLGDKDVAALAGSLKDVPQSPAETRRRAAETARQLNDRLFSEFAKRFSGLAEAVSKEQKYFSHYYLTAGNDVVMSAMFSGLASRKGGPALRAMKDGELASIMRRFFDRVIERDAQDERNSWSLDVENDVGERSQESLSHLRNADRIMDGMRKWLAGKGFSYEDPGDRVGVGHLVMSNGYGRQPYPGQKGNSKVVNRILMSMDEGGETCYASIGYEMRKVLIQSYWSYQMHVTSFCMARGNAGVAPFHFGKNNGTALGAPITNFGRMEQEMATCARSVMAVVREWLGESGKGDSEVPDVPAGPEDISEMPAVPAEEKG